MKTDEKKKLAQEIVATLDLKGICDVDKCKVLSCAYHIPKSKLPVKPRK